MSPDHLRDQSPLPTCLAEPSSSAAAARAQREDDRLRDRVDDAADQDSSLIAVRRSGDGDRVAQTTFAIRQSMPFGPTGA